MGHRLPPLDSARGDSGDGRSACRPGYRRSRKSFKPKISCLKYVRRIARVPRNEPDQREERRMRVACIGGGPAGLYFAISMKLRDPSHEVIVFERNRPDDTFGWGVVLSDEALGNLAAQRPRQRRLHPRELRLLGRRRRRVQGRAHRLRRPRLLRHRPDEAPPPPPGPRPRARRRPALPERHPRRARSRRSPRDYDLVVSSDGLNSRTRTLYADHFKPDVDVRKCKFVWLGTRQKFHDAFTFIFKETEKGWLWAHAYQFDADTATFIVECSEETWNAYGFGEMSQEESIATCERDLRRRARRPPPHLQRQATSAARPGSASPASSARTGPTRTSS